MKLANGPTGDLKKSILRVLIADGRSSIRQELKESLAKVKGVQVVGEAGNGSEAIEQAEHLRVDVVLMSHDLPGMSADSTTRRIKAKRPKTRVWILADGEGGRDEAVGMGVDGYFVKESSNRDLIEAFKKLHAYRQLPRVISPEVKPPELTWGAKRLWTTFGIVFGFVLLASLILFPRISLPTIALICGFFFLFYGLKYYGSVALILMATSGSPNGNGNGNGLNGVFNGMGVTNGLKHKPDLEKPGLFRALVGRILGWDPNGGSNGTGSVQREDQDNGRSLKNGNGYHFRGSEQPFISIHLPLYNETRVVDRLLEACTRLDYQNYEVLVADDSTDKTIHHLEKWAKHPKVKVSHRINRTGFKGAALKHAMEVMDPRTRFIAVFDADFIPPPNVLHQFLSYFFGVNGNNGNNHVNGKNGHELELIDESLAVVQGYQWHVLNASENWITRGVRTEFSGSYVVERPGQELTAGMKMISGSVFMIRADLLRDMGWGTSITEDWELTLRLYLEGYRVLYSPFIQAPAECVSDFKQLARQRMRWAEGHTFNVKKYFLSILRSPKLTWREKLEFYYYVPYYLQSVLFILGTAAWFISEIFLRTHLPFWTATLGWSLVFTNTFALIFMNVAGLYLERGVRRNFGGLLSFVLLTFLLVPYQAYAALKGLLEPHEGGWHRTTKTGVITDVIDRLGLGKRMRRLAPKKKKKGIDLSKRLPIAKLTRWIPQPIRTLVGKSSLAARMASGLLGGIVILVLLSRSVNVVSAAPDVFYLHDASASSSPAWYDSNWSYRQRLTIDNTEVSGTSNLSYFPVLINRTEADWADTGNGGYVAQSDGGDILFTDANGTKLDHEIERYINTSGELIAWVEVPTVYYNSDTHIYIYYGNAGASDQWNIAGTWDAHYLAVYHLNQDPSGTVYDSTGNSVDLSSGGTMNSGDLVGGQIGDGLDFDGTEDRLASGATQITTESFTIEAWVSSDDWTDWRTIADIDDPGADFRDFVAWDGDPSIDTGTNYQIAATQSGTAWRQMVARYDDGAGSNRLRGFIDGQITGYTPGAPNWPSITGTVSLGAWWYDDVGGYTDFWDGTLDEIRISDIPRPADWIATEFANQDSPSTFFKSLGPVETKGVTPAGKMMNTTVGSGASTLTFDTPSQDAYWYTELAYPDVGDTTIIEAGDYTLNMYFSQLPQVPSDWYNASWLYRKPITIYGSKVGSGGVSNFPVLIDLSSDTELAASACNAPTAGYDILFTSSNGTSKLSHEIETFNDSTGALVAWVKVPSLTNPANTTIYMYYGNSSCTDQQDVTNVWSSYVGVWHMKESSGSGYYVRNSAQNNYHANAGSTDYLSSSIIDGGRDFDNSYLTVQNGTNLLEGDTAFTLELWGYPDYASDSAWSSAGEDEFLESNSVWGCRWQQSGTGTGWLQCDVHWTSGTDYPNCWDVLNRQQWNHMVLTYNGTYLRWYVNGSQCTSITHSGMTLATNSSLTFGGSSGYQMNSNFDEYRYLRSGLTGGWILTEYNNQGDPSNFYSVGSEEGLPSVDITVSVYRTDSDGSDPQEIVTSSTITIDAYTSDPYVLPIGSGTEQTFTSSDPQRLRIHIDVTGVNGSGSFTLAYDSSSNPSSLDTPVVTVPDLTIYLIAVVVFIPVVMNIFMRKRRLVTRIAMFMVSFLVALALLGQQVLPASAAPDVFYFRDTTTNGASPAGEDMNIIQGSSEDTLTFDDASDEAYWYTDITYPTGGDDASIAAGNYTLNMYFDQLPTWYDADWDCRKKITINASQVPGDLTNFPVLVNLSSDSDLASGAQGDGDDILFTTSDGMTKVSHEIEYFNGSSGALQAWVELPSVSGSSNTDFYMYYCNSGASNQEDVANTWDNGFVAVQHLAESTGTQTDSTGRGNTGTLNGTTTFDSSSQIDGGRDFDGSSGYIGIANSTDINTGGPYTDRTITLWFNADSTSGRQVIFEEGAQVRGFNIYIDSGYLYVGGWNTTESGWSGTWHSTSISANTWYYVTLLLTGGTSTVQSDVFKAYLNGSSIGSGDGSQVWAHSGAINTARSDGASLYHDGQFSSNYYYDGTIDEWRVANATRSTDWITAEYNNQGDPGAFYNFNSEEVQPTVNITVSVYHTKSDGTDPQEIITSSSIEINCETSDPYALPIGSGLQQTFTSSDPRRLRAHIDVTGVTGSGSFTLAYDSSANPSSLDTPSMTIPEFTLYLMLLVYFIPIVTGLVTRKRRLVFRLLSVISTIVLSLGILATRVVPVSAEVSETTNTFWFYDDTTPQQYMMYQTQPSGSETSETTTTINFYSDTFADGWQMNSGTTSVYMVCTNGFGTAWTLTLYAGSIGDWTNLGSTDWSVPTGAKQLRSTSFSTSSYDFSSGDQLRLEVQIAFGGTAYWDGSSNDSRLVTPTLMIPEWGLLFILMMPLIPAVMAVFWRKRRLANQLVSVFLAVGVALSMVAIDVKEVRAAPDTFYLHSTTTSGITPAGEYMNTTEGSGGSTKDFNAVAQNAYWYVDATWPTGNDNATIAAGNYTFNMYFNALPGAGSGDYPQVATTNTSTTTSASTSHTVSLPSGISSGDLLIAMLSGYIGSGSTPVDISWPSGWTEFFEEDASSGSLHLAVAGAYRQANGSEGASITVTTNVSVLAAHNTYRITGAADPSTQPPEAATIAYTDTSNSIDPPSLSPTGGAKDYLWLAVAGWRRTFLSATGDPTNYTNPIEGNSGGYANGTRLRSLYRQLNASSEDPSAFTISGNSERRIGVTIAVHPAASVDIQVTVSHTAPDGSGATTIVTSPVTTIDSNTADPFALSIGSGALQTFTSASPRRLRLQVNVVSVSDGGNFILDYDGTCASSRCSNLDTPVVVVPETAVALVPVALVVPILVGMVKRRKESELTPESIGRREGKHGPNSKCTNP